MHTCHAAWIIKDHGWAWSHGFDTLLPACCREAAVQHTGLAVEELTARTEVGRPTASVQWEDKRFVFPVVSKMPYNSI